MLKSRGKMKTGSPWAMIRTGMKVIAIMAAFLCLTGGPAEAAAPFTPSFSPEVSLIPYDQQAKQQDSPALGIDSSGNLYALWVDYRNGHPDIYFSFRPAGGAWGSNVKVNDDTGKAGQTNPALAVDESGNAFAVWQDERNDRGDIYFAYRPVGGAWESNIQVNDDTGTAWQGDPAIAIDGTGKAYVIWQDFRNDLQNLFFSVVSKPSSAWSAATNSRVNDANGVRPGSPSIGFYSLGTTNLAIAVWQDYRNGDPDIYAASLVLGPGGIWGTNSQVNDDGVGASQRNPKVAVRGYDLIYVWEDYRNGNWDIYSYIPLFMGTRPPNKRVNNDTGTAEQRNPSITLDANNAYAIWIDRRNGSPEIYYAFPSGSGDWTNEKVNCHVSNPQDPIISVSSSNQRFVLYRDVVKGNPDILFTWEWELQSLFEPLKVNDDSGTVIQRDPALAVDKTGNATALWGDVRNEVGLLSIYSAHRPSGGSWGAYAPVVDLYRPQGPSLALDRNNNAYAVWWGERIFFSYRPAGGAWGASVPVSTVNNQMFDPDIAADPDGNAYAVWAGFNQGGTDIFFAYRPAGGTWGTNVVVNDDTSTAGKGAPAIAVDGSGNALAIWEDARNGGRDIFASYRPAGGIWGSNVKVNESAGFGSAWSPAVAMDRLGNAYALWMEIASGGLNADIYFAYRPVGGTWGSPVKVLAGSSWNSVPDIAADDKGNAFAVWVGGSQIYFSYRPAGGSWTGPSQVSTDLSGKTNPCLALDGNRNIYILWEDRRYGGDAPAVFFSYAAGPPWEIYLPLISK